MDILRIKRVIENFSKVMLTMLLLEVPYFLIGEFYKVFGPYSSFYYPNGGMVVVWILVILALYAPFVVQYLFLRKVFVSCIKSIHPMYDFSKTDGAVIVPKSLENSIGLRIGIYQKH
jgi:hypothetical protein